MSTVAFLTKMFQQPHKKLFKEKKETARLKQD